MTLFEIGTIIIEWLDHNCIEIDDENIEEARAAVNGCIDDAFNDYINMRRNADE